jgi:hypothetical protein
MQGLGMLEVAVGEAFIMLVGSLKNYVIEK